MKLNETYDPYKSFISTFIVPRISGKIGVKVRPTIGYWASSEDKLLIRSMTYGLLL